MSARADVGLAGVLEVGRRREVQVSACVALVVWAALSGRGGGSYLAAPLVFVLAMLGCLPLVTLRRLPAVSVGTVLAANGAFILFGRLVWPVPVIVAWLLVLFLAPVVLGERAALFAVLVTELAVLAAAAVVPDRVSATPWDATVAEALAAVLAWSVGTRLRDRHRGDQARAAAAERLHALERANEASRGRVELARELHDVVAHHVSLIAVRAATARYAMTELPAQAAEAFDEIADQARTALGELRTVLGVLRSPQAGVEQAPLPQLADIDELVARVRAAGRDVELRVTGKRSVPETVQLCGYRIVQEALTNAGRYAPESAVVVELEYRSDALAVRVVDDGRGASGSPAGVGYGLIGMRERVALLGGTLQAGPAGPGFEVCAHLPLATTA